MKILKTIALVLLLNLPFTFFGQTYGVDPSFNVGGSGLLGSAIAMLQQTDGKIIIAGSFISYNGVGRNNIARLNADGSLDLSFDPGTGPMANGNPAAIYSLAIDADGKILIGGNFTSFRGTLRNCLARLNDNGTIDTTFTGTNLFSSVPSVLSKSVRAIKVASDGKILIGGSFAATGHSQHHFIRLNADGSYDTGFVYPNNTFDNLADVRDIQIQPDGKIIIGINGVFGTPIMRFNDDGSIDTAFLFSGFYLVGNKIFIDSDGKILLGGLMISNDQLYRYNLIKLNSDGSIDATFTAISASTGSSSNNSVFGIKQSGNNFLIGGNLNYANNIVNDRIIRVNAVGIADSSFSVGTGPNSTVYGIDLTNENKVLVAGAFSTINGVLSRGISRLGNVDLSISTNSVRAAFYTDGTNYSFESTIPISSIFVFSIEGKKLHELSAINNLNFSIPNSFDHGIKFFKVKFIDGTEKVFKTVD
jgi:uncharacterized delta-60 repeat protein